MNPSALSAQDKKREVEFFDGFDEVNGYNVFTADSSERLISMVVSLGEFRAGMRIADLGCGSGIFTDLLQHRGLRCVGIDLSPRLIETARRNYPDIEFVEGDVENLPFPDGSFDGVLLSGIIHHLPDASRCAAEVSRILRPNGRFVAFDPNRRNPFMYLYRDRSSPFYSPIGVTPNERPVLAEHVASIFRQAGFDVKTDYLSNLRYQYIASQRMGRLLPIYNAIDAALFGLRLMRPFRPFVITSGEKR